MGQVVPVIYSGLSSRLGMRMKETATHGLTYAAVTQASLIFMQLMTTLSGAPYLPRTLP